MFRYYTPLIEQLVVLVLGVHQRIFCQSWVLVFQPQGDSQQVWLCPSGSQSNSLEGLPPLHKDGQGSLLRCKEMDLDEDLTDRELLVAGALEKR
jgi:hypothetical protein